MLRCEGGLYQRLINFLLNGTKVAEARTDGQGVVRASFHLGDSVAPGQATVTAQYNGDDVRGPCSDAKPMTIVSAPTDLVVGDTFGDAGAMGVVMARLRRTTDYEGVSGRRVDFRIDGTSVGHASTDARGWASLEVSLPEGMAPGSHPVAASFGGDVSYGGSSATGTLTVRQATVLAVEDSAGPPETAVPLRAQVQRQSDGTPVEGVSVVFEVGGTYAGSAATGADGIAVLSWAVTDGPVTRTLAAAFDGNSTYQGSSAEGTFTLVAGDTTLSVADIASTPGGTAALRAHLSRTHDGGGVAGKSVTFTLEGTGIGSVTTDDEGTAVHDYSVPWTMTAGTYTVVAQFSGDAGYNPSSGSGTLTLAHAGCVLTVTDADGLPGDLVSLEAVLARSTDAVGIAGRSVAFVLDGSPIGAAETGSAGIASLAHRLPSDMAAGTYALEATFAGDETFLPSAGSGRLTVLPVSTELLVNDVFAEPGTSANLTACLRQTAGSKPGIAGKTVEFAVAGTSLGPGSLTNSNGMSYMAYAVPSDLSSSQTISASFSGDATYAASSGSGTLYVGRPNLRMSLVSLTRQSGQVIAMINIRNTGTAPARACRVTLATLRSAATVTPLPVTVGDIPQGPDGVNVQLVWNGTVGAPGVATLLRVTAVHATGSASSSLRVTLP
ncbi:MAG: Ig-like domain repeat protein [Chthonomonadales bacterium]|nr:Ig-like domain repeat protein [Chthonomonadales bacterium]